MMLFVYIVLGVTILLCLAGFVWNHKKDDTGWNEDDEEWLNR